jgi:hypothetical protein
MPYFGQAFPQLCPCQEPTSTQSSPSPPPRSTNPALRAFSLVDFVIACVNICGSRGFTSLNPHAPFKDDQLIGGLFVTAVTLRS